MDTMEKNETGNDFALEAINQMKFFAVEFICNLRPQIPSEHVMCILNSDHGSHTDDADAGREAVQVVWQCRREAMQAEAQCGLGENAGRKLVTYLVL